MMNLRKTALHIIIVALTLITSACGNRQDNFPPAKIERLDLAIAQGDIPDSLSSGAGLLVAVMSEIRGDSVSVRDIASSRATSMFTAAIEERLGSLDTVQDILGNGFGRLGKTDSLIRLPELYGVVLPVKNSIIVSDSTVLIGLNHYLGSDFEGYTGFNDYDRKGKIKARIPLDVTEAVLATMYGFDSGKYPSVLERMLYEGLLLKALTEAYPDTPMYLFLNTDRNGISFLDKNLAPLYRKMLEENMLFSTDPIISAKLFNPSASTSLLSEEAPGMAGRYIGLKMVESYLKQHPGSTPLSLLKSGWYGDKNALRDARFNPD